ncbi:MAG: YhbY family RNA-binding protein [Clostridiales bacterium]|nr:YhbY family RNA-binding protein [Clostridiales bacterium]
MTSKRRAYLRGLANNMDAIIFVGKTGVTPELINSADEALAARELIKIGVQENCPAPVKDAAIMVGERTRSEVVQVIGRKFVLYRKPKADKKPQIVFPD